MSVAVNVSKGNINRVDSIVAMSIAGVALVLSGLGLSTAYNDSDFPSMQNVASTVHTIETTVTVSGSAGLILTP